MRSDSIRPKPPTLGPWAVLGWTLFLGFQASLLWTYLRVTGVSLSAFHVYPFVWITVGVAAVWGTDAPSVSRRRAAVGVGIATAYFLVLAVVGGVFGLYLGSSDQTAYGLRIAASTPPGYGPAVYYVGEVVYLSLSPYTLVGYASLSYLVYVTILDAQRAAVSGLLGLVTCVGCTWPIVASLLTGVVGGGTTVATSVYAQSHELSTAVFVVTVALLYWRPFSG